MTTPHLPAAPAPLDQPQYGATFRQGVGRFFRKYATFRGRASQSELWWGVLLTTILGLVSAGPYVVATVGYSISSALVVTSDPADAVSSMMSWMLVLLASLAFMALVSLATVVPTFALIVRRLHDVGWTGWLCLLQWPTSGAWIYALGFLPARADGLRYEQPGSLALVPPDVAAQVHAMAMAYGAQPPYGPSHPFGVQRAGEPVQVAVPWPAMPQPPAQPTMQPQQMQHAGQPADWPAQQPG